MANEFRILGPFEVADENGRVQLLRRKQRALLAVLVLRRGEVVATHRLIDDLWGAYPPKAAKAALHNYVAQLRRALGANVIVRRDPGYLLDAAPEQVDLDCFVRLTDGARASSEAAERAELLRAALALWRGPPLADLEDEPFALLEVPHLANLRVGACVDLIDAELELGHNASAIREIEVLLAAQPLSSYLWERSMLALYRAGRDADALAAYERAAEALDQIGQFPGPELQQRQRQILNHDPALLLPEPPALAGVAARKLATVLFADVGRPAGSDDRLDPERLLRRDRSDLGEARAAVERRGGTTVSFGGGSLMAVFGITAHEDDALRAVRAALEVRAAMSAGMPGWGPPRIGISTGEVLLDGAGGALTVHGTPVSLARLAQQAASGDEIVISGSTLRLVRDAVRVERIGTGETGAAGEAGALLFRLIGLIEGAAAFGRRYETPLVDRERELAFLAASLEQAGREGSRTVVTVLGEAGVGKTRLASELLRRVGDDVTVLVGRCVASDEGATYVPVREMVDQAAGDLTALLDGAASSGEQHLRIRRYFEQVAMQRPLALVFEDIHWAGPTVLALIEYLGAQFSGSPLLVLCLARPGLLDLRADWPVSLRLGPLGADHARELVERLSPGAELGRVARILEVAEGNPLFVEQLLAFADEGGELGHVPPTIEAVLATRIDGLGPSERALLQCASVVGRTFSPDVVAALSRWSEPPSLTVALETLARHGLVRRTAAGYQFSHGLIRDVAYGSLLKAERASLHSRLAWHLADGSDGMDEVVGFHLEQSFLYRDELGEVDEAARREGAEAGARLGAAGTHSWKLGDARAAVNLLDRAVALLAADEPARLDLLCELGVALRGSGEVHRAEEVLADARRRASSIGVPRAELRARLELANVRLFTGSGGSVDELLAVAREAIPVFATERDERGLSRAWRLIAYVDGAMRCRYATSAEAAERALVHCRRSGWSTAACLGELAAVVRYGPTPATAGVRRCRELLGDADHSGQANILVQLGPLEAMQGRFAQGRRLVDRAQRLYENLGQAAFAYINCGSARGEIELLAGRVGAADEALRESYGPLEAIGDRAHLATRAAQLADVAYLDERRDEAMEWSRRAEAAAGADDLPTQFLWRSVRAKVLATRSEVGAAVQLANEAVGLAAGTDAVDQRAKVTLDLAEVLHLCGREVESAEAAGLAFDLFAQKENVAALRQAHARFAR